MNRITRPLLFACSAALTLLALAREATAQTGIVAWGLDTSSQCTPLPQLPPGLAWGQVSAGAFHSAAPVSDGSVVAWGNNTYGQCTVPALPPGTTYVDVSAG